MNTYGNGTTHSLITASDSLKMKCSLGKCDEKISEPHKNRARKAAEQAQMVRALGLSTLHRRRRRTTEHMRKMVAHKCSHSTQLTLGNRGQVKRRVHARTHVRPSPRAPLPPPTPLSPLPKKTFLPLLSPQITAFFSSVLFISGFVRDFLRSNSATLNL
jgi:hypothetical protein